MGGPGKGFHQPVRQGTDQKGAVGVIPGFPFLRPPFGSVDADGHGPDVVLYPFRGDEVRQGQTLSALGVQLLPLGQQGGLRNGSGFIRPDGDVVMVGSGIGRKDADDAAGLVAVFLHGLFQQVAGILVQGRGGVRLGRVLGAEFLPGVAPDTMQFPGMEEGRPVDAADQFLNGHVIPGPRRSGTGGT